VTLQLHLFEAAGRVLVQQARDQRLVRQPFRERALLDRLQVLARQPDVQPAILAERGLGMAAPDLDRSINYLFGPLTIRSLLWDAILSHAVHHRGQLSVLCRLAGGTVPSLYGPTREDAAALRAAFPEKPLLDRAYAAFNARRLDEVLSLMHEGVTWPNGMEGGYLRDGTRCASTGRSSGCRSIRAYILAGSDGSLTVASRLRCIRSSMI
jgi:DinB family protein